MMDSLTSANLIAWAVQAGLVVLVAAPLPRLLGLWSPRVRVAYWRAVLLACLLLPLMQPWVTRPEPPRSAAPGEMVATADATAAPGTVTAPPTVNVSPRRSFLEWSLPFGAAELLIAGIVLRLGWLGLGVITVGRLRRSARPLWPRPPSIDRAATLVETDAEFLVSATTARPVTCGLLWPVVLVPRTFESFPEHEQTAIACHELLHVRRADWVRNAADEVLRAVLWFHPGIWWLTDQIQLAREQVVDREVVRRLGTRQPYLEALLRMAKPAPRLILTPASLFLRRAHLRQRVALLVKEASMSTARLAASLTVMAVVILIGGRIATSALPLQQSGARTPGVQTAVPKLTSDRPVTLDLTGTTLQAALRAFSGATGISVTFGDVPASLLDKTLTIHLDGGSTADQALGVITRAAGLSYTVTSARSVIVRPQGAVAGGVAGGVPGGVAGGVAPGMATGAGVSGGVGGGVSAGVPGGRSGGIVGGAAGGVEGALAGRVTLGPAELARATVSGGTAGVTRRADPQAPGATGRSIVALVIDSNGSVATAMPQGPAGVPDDAFASQAAVEAAKRWSFEASTAEVRTALLAFNLTPQNTAGDADVPVVRVGGSVPPPRRVRDVKPVYPPEALATRLEGVQIVEITIDPSGAVLDARSLRGNLTLLRSALDTVLQWQFEPWPGPERRLMTVTVNYTLADSPHTAGTATPARDAAEKGGASPAPAQYGSAANWPTDAVRVGGNIGPPVKTVDVRAEYPDVAQKARVQGVVICDVLIGPEGKVREARVVRSIPLLDQAAVDAVRQWEFRPTLLNGNPISVVMTVTVNFTLQ